MDTTSVNLPVRVAREGGAIVEVLGWEQHLVLSPQQQYAIGVLVALNPLLNTEARIDMLADMAGFHGEQLDREVIDLIAEYGAETVYIAIDYLYEVARRDRRGDARERNEVKCERSELAKTAELIGVLERLGYETTPAVIEHLVRRLGGLNDAWEMSEQDIEQTLAGTRED